MHDMQCTITFAMCECTCRMMTCGDTQSMEFVMSNMSGISWIPCHNMKSSDTHDVKRVIPHYREWGYM